MTDDDVQAALAAWRGRGADQVDTSECDRAQRRTILVIDDEAMITTALRRILGDHDVRVLNAALPALEQITGGARFDLILCDLMMPRMTGMDLYNELARVAPEQASRMIVMTGGAVTSEAREFLAATRVPRVDKPFDVDVVRALIEQIARS